MRYKYLTARGALNEADARQAGHPPRLPHGHTAIAPVLPSVVELIPESVARDNKVMPLYLDGETLTVAAVDPENIGLADKLRFLLAKDVRLVGATPEAIAEAIDRHYGRPGEESIVSLVKDLGDTDFDVADGLMEATEEDIRPASKGLGFGKKGLMGPLKGGAEAPARRRRYSRPGLDVTPRLGGTGVFYYIVEEGRRVLMRRPDGTVSVVVGPKRVWRGRSVFTPMEHYVAHPGEFLIVRFRDGRQEHWPGPAEIWLDPRVHQEITREDALQLAAKEAVVVYTKAVGSDKVTRRIVYGPCLFVPQPGEWLHTFSWHASQGGHKGAQKVPKGLVFQKLWLMPDQMYHDVTDVRTTDDAVLTVRLMIFFELIDIERMLESTHDPIGDFVNAATSDVVDFTAKHDFESFKHNTERLNEPETYRQLAGRAAQCGYRINKVVYRGYGATEALQQMHDQAIEARTRLKLDQATEQQAQDLEDFKLDCQIARAGKRRTEQGEEVEHDLALARKRQEAELRQREAQQALVREQKRQDAELQMELRRRQDAQQREHLAALAAMQVDLTAYLTQSRADRVIELRGSVPGTHVHLEQTRSERDGGGG
jgi:hypothetical protein